VESAQAVAQASGSSQSRRVWLPASLMETRPLAATPHRSKGRAKAEVASVTSPETHRSNSALVSRAPSKHSPGRPPRHSPMLPNSAREGHARSKRSPNRPPKHSPTRSRTVCDGRDWSQHSLRRSPRRNPAEDVTSTTNSPGPLSTNYRGPSAIIGNSNPLNEQKMFCNAGDLAWASSLRTSGLMRSQVSHSVDQPLSSTVSSPPNASGATRSSTNMSKQRTTGQSAIIGDGTPLVHGHMFSNAGQHSWASSLRSSGCPRGCASPSHGTSRSNIEWSEVFASQGNADSCAGSISARINNKHLAAVADWSVHEPSQSGDTRHLYGRAVPVSERAGATWHFDATRTSAPHARSPDRYDRPARATPRVPARALRRTLGPTAGERQQQQQGQHNQL
jgi:hypothetical protein